MDLETTSTLRSPGAEPALEPLHILYVTLQGLEPWQGAGTHVAAIVDGLAQEDEVTLCAPRPGRSAGMISRLRAMLAVHRRALRQSRAADVVYLRHHPFLLPLTLLLRARGLPVVHELNGPLEDVLAIYPQLRPVFPLLRRWSIRGMQEADAVVVVSLRMREYVYDMGVAPAKIEVVHNGADTRVFCPGDAPPGRDVVFVGAFSPWQGLPALAAATREPAWPDDVRLLVAGHGTEEHVLDAADPSRIVRLGVVAHEEVPAIVQRALATVSPKTSASSLQSPLKLYESLACGVPSIVTDVGEQADVVRDTGSGIIVTVDSPRAIAQAVRLLAEDEHLRARLGRAAARTRWTISWEARVRQIRGLLGALTDAPVADPVLSALSGSERRWT